ncbi:MAG: NTP transferase domain-containing protein [Polyangiales bacterium]
MKVDLALVLAAGEGRRMGAPKAALTWGHRPLAIAHAVAALDAGCAEVRVVVRAPVVASFPALPAGARWVFSREDEALGPAGSIVAALCEGLGGASLIAVSPVDLDPDAWRCLGALSAAFEDARVMAAKPRYEGRSGHPVLVRAGVLAPYLRREARPLRDVLRALGAGLVSVPVDVAAVPGDLDTPDDLEALARDGDHRTQKR